MPPKKGATYKPRQPKPSKDLEDARWVYDHPTAEPGTEARRQLQELFATDFKAFLTRKDKLEEQLLRQTPGRAESPGVSPGTPESDAGSATLVELIDRLRAEMRQP